MSSTTRESINIRPKRLGEHASVSAAVPANASEKLTVLEPTCNFRLNDWSELVVYRDLFRFLIFREIKVRYSQSAIGVGWAVLQPLCSMLIFTVIFGRLANVSSDGAPYALFSFAALVPWMYFSNAVSDGASSLLSEADMIRKVYFPRIFMPLSAVAAKLVDFGIAMGVLAILMFGYGVLPGVGVIALPLLVALMVVTAAAISLWLTAAAVQYRDVKHAMTFVLQLAMYASPVVYPTTLIPESWRWVYAINPMVGVIEGFRSALLNTQPMPWQWIGIGAVSATIALLSGLAFFRSKERIFADVA